MRASGRAWTTTKTLTYELRHGVLRDVIRAAGEAVEQPHFLIVDEINRANLPRVLGELLFALEYRGPGNEVQLPYSGERLYVPENVWLIGTMNTADRSVALMDAAMRRRFKEFRFDVDYDALRRWHEKRTSSELGDEAAQRLERLNAEVIALLDDDRAIGHSFLMRNDLADVGLRGHLARRSRTRSPRSPARAHRRSAGARGGLSGRVVTSELSFTETDSAREVSVTSAELRALRRARHGLAVEEIEEGRARVGPRQGFAGTVLLPTGRRVVVQPKAPIASIPELLALAYRTLAPPASAGSAAVEEATPTDWLLLQLAGEVRELLARGLRRGYVEQRELLSYVRGRMRPPLNPSRLPFRTASTRTSSSTPPRIDCCAEFSNSSPLPRAIPSSEPSCATLSPPSPRSG